MLLTPNSQGQNVQAIERLIKTAIVDKTPSVSSAALVSAYHLHPLAKDVVRRWANETQEAVQATKSFGSSLISGFGGGSSAAPGTGMSQYHAIGLLYKMREHDRMALVKMVQQFGQAGVVKNAAGVVLLVRLAAKLAEEDPNLRKPMWTLLDGWLRHKAEMVNFEAAKAICNLSNVSDQEVAPAIHGEYPSPMVSGALAYFFSSPSTIPHFATECFKIHSNPHSSQLCFYPSCGCECMQYGHREPNQQPQPLDSDFCYHNLTQDW